MNDRCSAELAADHQVQQVLQRRQRLAAPADQDAEVVALDIEHGLCHAEAVARGLRVADRNVGLDPHQLEQVVEHLRREFGLVLDEFAFFACGCVRGFAAALGGLIGLDVAEQPHEHARLRAANAEDAALALGEDLDVDLVAAGAQLFERVLDGFFDCLTACLDAAHVVSFAHPACRYRTQARR